MRVKPVDLILIGAALVVLGAVLPFLMVIRLVTSTMTLNFVAALASIGGLFVGLYGTVEYQRSRKK